jgi:hypothetical protein
MRFLTIRRIPPRVLAAFLALVLGPGRTAVAADPIPLEIHEWSLWIVDPTLAQSNAKDHYPNTLPVFVDSTRSRLSGRSENRPSPLGVITFYGEPTHGLEVELQLATSSRFLAHWPPAETKSKRARWLDLALSTAPDAEGRIAPVEEKHWMELARALEGTLHLRHGTRTERFLCYDVETGWAPAVKLTGGPDSYQVENLGKSAVEDLFVFAPAGDARRVGRLKLLPAKAAEPAAEKDKKPAGADQPAKDGTKVAESKTGEPAQDGKANEEQAKEEKPSAEAKPDVADAKAEAKAPDAKDAKPATAGDEKPAATQEGEKAPAAKKPPTVEIVMSEALAPDSQAYIDQTRTALRTVLVDAGLKAGEADLIVSSYADQIFDAKEMLVLFRLPASAIDEQFPLVTYPDAKRMVRVPLVLLRNADPRLQGGLQDLVVQLGAADFQGRETAEKGLKESGRLAVPLLKEALKNADPEVVFRAERLLLAQNELIDASSAVLPMPKKEDKKEEKKDEKTGEKKDDAKDKEGKKEDKKTEEKAEKTEDAAEDGEATLDVTIEAAPS